MRYIETRGVYRRAASISYEPVDMPNGPGHGTPPPYWSQFRPDPDQTDSRMTLGDRPMQTMAESLEERMYHGIWNKCVTNINGSERMPPDFPGIMRMDPQMFRRPDQWSIPRPVSYTHLTLPTKA